ncbi:MAG: CoA-binding protein [Gemmatimonadota bacterium]|nr:MAG: CoA-binding protein [Gemmatimonadota bacterium]
MHGLRESVTDFLAQRRIAVAGVSRSTGEAANLIYRKLRGAGYEVFPVNPSADRVEGDACYPELGAVPGGVDGVVIATPPAAAEAIVRQCHALGIRRVWMHRSVGQGSVSEAAVQFCREHGIAVIPGACPMMYCEPVDVAHRCLRWFLGTIGKLPRTN